MLQRLSYVETILLFQFTIGGHNKPSLLLHLFTDTKNKNYELIHKLYKIKIAYKTCSYDWKIHKMILFVVEHHAATGDYCIRCKIL